MKDLTRALRIMISLLIKVHRADIFLLWANSSFICTLGIPLMFFARIAGKPYIVKMFGTMLAQLIGNLGMIRRKSVLSNLGRARYLLPQTLMLADELAELDGLDPERIVQFPNFLPDSYFTGTQPERRFSGKCVFIGQIKSEKGVFDIIESIRGRKDISCDFYGQYADRDVKRFMHEIEQSPNCIYRGLISRDEVMEILEQYDILLLPTRHEGEGYPAVVLEAFAAGLPVICTNWKAIPELVEDGVRGLLVPPSSPPHISAALDLLSKDRELYASIARNTYEYVERFSEKEIVGDLLTGLVSESIGQ